MTIHILLRTLEEPALKKVADISGENVYSCMQCGTCSSVCPMVEEMDVTPRQAMLLLQHGQAEVLAEAKSPWLCASCHTCLVRCPRGIDVPKVMEALRQVILRQNVDRIDPRRISREILEEAPPIAMVSTFRKMTA